MRAAVQSFVPSASAKGAFYPFGQASGDLGVRSLQSITNGATNTSGQYVLVAYRVLLYLASIVTMGNGFGVDALTGGFPKIANGAVPFLVTLNASASSFPTLVYQEAQG